MKSKLNKRRGFTIAEIIMAVAIMAILIGTVMKSLQSSRESVKADMVRAEMAKKYGLIKGKVEAALAGGLSIDTGLTYILSSKDLLDLNGEPYDIKFTEGLNGGQHTLTLSPGPKGTALGVTTETYKW